MASTIGLNQWANQGKDLNCTSQQEEKKNNGFFNL